MNKLITTILSTCLINLGSCKQQKQGLEAVAVNWDKTKEFWQGAAELNRYELKQKFYGNMISGKGMFIFVREPFLKDRQVKDESGSGNYQVLKLNATREFTTGFYPYYTMMSVFQPMNEDSTGKALKITTSVQDWCGHVFMQTNRKGNTTKIEVKSYFEQAEGQSFKAKSSTMLEDEVWTALRLNPTKLPTGDVMMIPGSLYQRFSHAKLSALKAKTKWTKGRVKNAVIYEIYYPSIERRLAIEIESKLPYRILGWSESNKDGLFSSAKLKKTLSDVEYWNFNDPKSGKQLRKKMGLD